MKTHELAAGLKAGIKERAKETDEFQQLAERYQKLQDLYAKKAKLLGTFPKLCKDVEDANIALRQKDQQLLEKATAALSKLDAANGEVQELDNQINELQGTNRLSAPQSIESEAEAVETFPSKRKKKSGRGGLPPLRDMILEFLGNRGSKTLPEIIKYLNGKGHPNHVAAADKEAYLQLVKNKLGAMKKEAYIVQVGPGVWKKK